VLPETAFPYFLNKADEIVELLKEKSYEITIVTGALKLEANSVYNSTYVFQNGQMRIFDKVVAVPFGEVNPLPEFMSKIVNNLFFNGAEDYKTAQKPSDFDIKGVRFRNAICYEATNAKIYEDRPKYIIAMSNNAWFLPSFEPTIQKMLMKHMSVKYGAVIYHSANKSSSFIIS
jgi:apolipoprotein N-acyltransferase